MAFAEDARELAVVDQHVVRPLDPGLPQEEQAGGGGGGEADDDVHDGYLEELEAKNA